jgi:hypothetical protein
VSAAAVIRPPRLRRWWAIGFSTVWCAGVGTATIIGFADGRGSAAIGLLMVAFGATLGWRLARLSVRCEGDLLIIRNNFRSRTLRRAEIEGFRVGQPQGGIPFGNVVYVLLDDDSVLPLDATLRMRRRGSVDRDLLRLKEWLG